MEAIFQDSTNSMSSIEDIEKLMGYLKKAEDAAAQALPSD
jgi:hypothetical protein